MNQTVEYSVRALNPLYGDMTDTQVIQEIRAGRSAGEALFYLLFARYQDMLHSLFLQNATPAMDFSDFMLELNMRLYAQGLAAIKKFDEKKASLATYLSRIAHNLLYDLRKKQRPTIDCKDCIIESRDDDEYLLMQLIDAINSYADADARYVLLKVIEGYKSKEIALMLTSRRHEDGTLDEDKTLKPSYIDTLRSRALRNIRKKMMESECPPIAVSSPCSDSAPCHSAAFELEATADKYIRESASTVCQFVNPFIENLRQLLFEVV